MKSFILLSSLALSTSAWAQDTRDDDIFGEGSENKKPVATSLADTLTVGGRLEFRATATHEEAADYEDAGFSQLKRADIYFDARPNEEVRTLLRLRVSENDNAAVTTAVDELWFKWDIADTAYVTAGKQHLKWGSGRMWNPTDFTARSTKDPFELFDARLGQNLLKIHVPIEKQGFNFYAVAQFDDVTEAQDIGAAVRAELPFLGIGEASFSAQMQKGRPWHAGADVSSGLGPIDAYVEAAFSGDDRRTFYDGELDPVNGTLPTEETRDDETFSQIVVGAQYSYKYSDDDSVTIGGEYFENGVGYDDRDIELYSLVLGQTTPMYAGKRYAGGYLRLPAPGSWNNTNFFLNALHNISDGSTIARVTVTWNIYKEITLEAFTSRCFGDYGEFCFRVPEKFQSLSTNPAFSEFEQKIIAALPNKRTKASLGLAVSMAF